MFGLPEDVKKTSVIDISSSRLVRFSDNPIITPDRKPWREKATYNPAAILLDGKVHLLYRAQGEDCVSRIGYAISTDGLHIDENLDEPVYVPRADFENGKKTGWNSGCEDPRITKIGDRLFMTYTAYDGESPPRVALTSISVTDFLNRNFNWEDPKLISPPGVDDKDACVIKKEGDGYVAFHRLGNALWIDSLWDLEFPEVKYLTGGIMAQARPDMWDNIKIGLAAPPIETSEGFLLLYHAVSNPGFSYKLGAMLLDKSEPKKIIARTNSPILEPEMDYEKNGQVENMVFSCGAVVINNYLYVYYGGGDKVVCVATAKLSDFLKGIKGA